MICVHFFKFINDFLCIITIVPNTDFRHIVIASINFSCYLLGSIFQYSNTNIVFFMIELLCRRHRICQFTYMLYVLNKFSPGFPNTKIRKSKEHCNKYTYTNCYNRNTRESFMCKYKIFIHTRQLLNNNFILQNTFSISIHQF